jgi:hypothetical protein
VDVQDPTAQDWLHAIKKDTDVQERLTTMVIDVVRAFQRDEFKDTKDVNEMVYLARVLSKDAFQDLLRDST